MLTFADPYGRRTAVVALRNSLYLIPLGFIAYDCELQFPNYEVIFFSFHGILVVILFLLHRSSEQSF